MSFWVQMTVDTFRDPKRTAEKIIQWQYVPINKST